MDGLNLNAIKMKVTNEMRTQLKLLTRNELQPYLEFFTANPKKLSASIKSKLVQEIKSKSLTYGYLESVYNVPKR
ncbi:MAG: hypothetical protein ACJA2S_002298 [Cyclobacteriaceae bacterium]|jgi:hypothetical protein